MNQEPVDTEPTVIETPATTRKRRTDRDRARRNLGTVTRAQFYRDLGEEEPPRVQITWPDAA